MRFSRLRLALKYANRTRHFTRGAVLFLAGIASGFPILLPLEIRELRLSLFGKPATATVKAKHVAAAPVRHASVGALFALGGRRGPTYRLTYEFAVDGEPFEGRADVSQARWEAAQFGQPFGVSYLPSDPTVQRAGGAVWLTGMEPFLAIGFATWGLGIYQFVKGVRDVRRRVRLVESGTPALGVVDGVEFGSYRTRRWVQSVRYRYFIDAASPALVGVESGLAFERDELREGETILVIYDPADPARHEIDFFRARQ
jgi:hypothetical protein